MRSSNGWEGTAAPGAPRTAGPGRLFFFAYGSGMHPDQCAFLGVKPFSARPARLPDHELGFFGYSGRWDGAMETVTPAPGVEVWGALYEIGFSALERLDDWQGARFDGAGPYFHVPVTVLDEDGADYFALCYRKDLCGAPTPPSAPYLRHIVQGARARGLPEGYVAALASRRAKTPAYPVPCGLRTVFRTGNSCADCSLE